MIPCVVKSELFTLQRHQRGARRHGTRPARVRARYAAGLASLRRGPLPRVSAASPRSHGAGSSTGTTPDLTNGFAPVPRQVRGTASRQPADKPPHANSHQLNSPPLAARTAALPSQRTPHATATRTKGAHRAIQTPPWPATQAPSLHAQASAAMGRRWQREIPVRRKDRSGRPHGPGENRGSEERPRRRAWNRGRGRRGSGRGVPGPAHTPHNPTPLVPQGHGPRQPGGSPVAGEDDPMQLLPVTCPPSHPRRDRRRGLQHRLPPPKNGGRCSSPSTPRPAVDSQSRHTHHTPAHHRHRGARQRPPGRHPPAPCPTDPLRLLRWSGLLRAPRREQRTLGTRTRRSPARRSRR